MLAYMLSMLMQLLALQIQKLECINLQLHAGITLSATGLRPDYVAQ